MGTSDKESFFFKYIFPGILLLIGVITYFAVPVVNAFVLEKSQGWRGLLYLVIAGILLVLYYWRFMRFSGGTLLYALSVVIFAIFCIWTLANHEMVFAFLEDNLGTWGMIGVLAVACAIIAIVMAILF